MTLQEHHFDKIEDFKQSVSDDLEQAVIESNFKDLSTQASTITKQFMKDFAEWLVIHSDWHYHTTEELWTDAFSWKTTDELIEIFLNQNNKQ